ncbi:MAG: NAD(P)-binding domain-containing protein, partial [Pseudomonadota bacterium]
MGEAKERIGFIGAGMMGSGMCRNLMQAGYAVTVIANRNRAPIDALIADGAMEAPTLAALADASDVIMICVNSADTVSDLTDRLKPHLRGGMLVIDVTTSKPDVTRRIADDLATREIGFVDAPVIGGPAQAASGDLGSFLGGTDTDVARAQPLIATYSADIAHFG